LSSEPFAARQVRRAISARDLQGTATALRVWSERLPATGDRSEQALQQGLMAIGAARYRDSGPENWSSLSSIFKATRKARQSAARKLNTGNALPPLNPM
jgi:hypothetical protein